MTWLPLAALLLIALCVVYRAGLNRGHAEGIVTGVLIAQSEDEPADPISEFVEAQRVASGEGLQ